jgi:hypothetical protein
LAKLKGGRLANGGDVVGEGKIVVKGDAEVTGGSGGRDRGLLEEEMAVRGGKFGKLLRGADQEVFGLGGVRGEFVGC